jgi:methylated-DNA-[protein]-cysteine S-methyltransferase
MMTQTRTPCLEIEPDLVAAATGEAEAVVAQRVEAHLGRCAPCGVEYHRYRAIDHAVGVWRTSPAPDGGAERARQRLQARLAELRRRTFTYRIFSSPLGNILIALSDEGVSLIEYLGRGRTLVHSRLHRMPGVETIEDGAEVEALYRELLEYLEGKRTRLEWPLDLRLARSEFHRTVLQITASIPYGAVMSYAGVACEVGKPSATRAVAQALRWNPLPIVIPCHRVVGTSGALTGYAGDRISLKQRLLETEGVRTLQAERDVKIPRDAMVVGEPNDPWYCRPTCSSLSSLSHPHRLLRFASREHAEAAGRAPCTTCRPDLYLPAARG